MMKKKQRTTKSDVFFLRTKKHTMRKKKVYDPTYYQQNKERFKKYAEKYKLKKKAIADGTYCAEVKQPLTEHEKSVRRHAKQRAFYEKRRAEYFAELAQQQTNKDDAVDF